MASTVHTAHSAELAALIGGVEQLRGDVGPLHWSTPAAGVVFTLEGAFQRALKTEQDVVWRAILSFGTQDDLACVQDRQSVEHVHCEVRVFVHKALELAKRRRVTAA